MKNRRNTLSSMLVFVIISGCLTILIVSFAFNLSSCKATDPIKSYKVKYVVSGTIPDAEIIYDEIPDNGAMANRKYASNTGGSTSLPWSSSLSATGYHRAPYYISAEYKTSTTSGWLYVKVYQDTTLVDYDSAVGTNQKIILKGNLPK